MTSTLQLEASRKLGMARSRRCAPPGALRGGHITYMRTDGVTMAREAVAAIRDHVKEAFGADYLPASPREYHPRRRTRRRRMRRSAPPRDPLAEAMARELDGAQLRLYELIWKRAVASQMAAAELDRRRWTSPRPMAASASAPPLRRRFDGFLKLYREDEDDRAADARAGIATRRPGGGGGRPHPAADGRARPAEAERRRRQPALHQPPPRYPSLAG